MLLPMPSSVELVLEIQDLCMRYPRSIGWALQGLDLRIAPGDRLALVGSSGCGKSNVAKVVIQLLHAGSIRQGE